jgi:transposase, IS30 family
MNNKQLTAADRGAIEALLQENYTIRKIAEVIGFDKSTVSREIKNKSTPHGYFAWSAQLDYEKQRKHCCKKKKINNSSTQKYISKKLQLGWSPEQIAGRLRKENNNKTVVCHETIYAWLYSDKWAFKEEKLFQYLRYGRKKRKKQTGRSTHRSKIPNRVSVHLRPKVVEKRTEYGHWEGDSVIYPNKYAINTLNDLSTGIVKLTKLQRKTAALTALAMKNQLEDEVAYTLTLDNGLEFTEHEYVSKNIGVEVYFCDPYSSWQRGANENCNMLLRGYLPKKHDISKLTQKELDQIADELNNRPRKRLNYQTPIEVYNILTSNSKKGINSVAVGSRI